MIGSPRTLGLALALVPFAAPALVHAAPSTRALTAVSWSADDVSDLFKQAVEQMQRGHKDEALKLFREVLAKNPTHEQAYAIWKDTDHQVWLDMLTEEGELELIAKRLMGLVDAGRAERKNDAEAIKKVLGQLRSDNSQESRAARNTLASEHGEYAVPFMLPTLAEQGNDDRRVLYMQTLTQMDRDVVIPLIEALNSPDAFLRRNVAYVLGYIGDQRAGGMLAHLASTDADGSVRSAAEEALGRCKCSGDALAEFLRQGEAYALRQENVLASYMYSDVVWNWSDKGLVAMPVPREVYADELSKKNYQRALAAAPGSLDASAGLARAYAAEIARLTALKDAGKDIGGMAAVLDNDMLQIGLVGPEAIDAALAKAVEQGDGTAGLALIRALASYHNAPTGGLVAALASRDGALRSEAAIALGDLAVMNRAPVGPDVVTVLGEAAGREVVRTVFVIEPNAEVRDAALAQAEKLGYASMGSDRGVNALVLLHRVPGVDAVIVSETLPDVTTFQVIDELRAEPRFEKTPIFVIATNVEQAKGLFGELATGVIGADADMTALGQAMGALTGDRATADQLAARAARTLGNIARAGGDIGSTLPSLVSTLATRDDAVTTQALATLGSAGDSSHVAAIVALLGDAKRSEPVRIAAAEALAGIFSHGASASKEDITAIQTAVNSDAPLSVRTAAARALGAMSLDPETRAELLYSTRTAPTKS